MVNGASLIETYNLVKRTGDTVAGRIVTFDVQAGEVFGFLGSNGAGNTALLRMITGREKPGRGYKPIDKSVKLVHADQMRPPDGGKKIREEICRSEEELTLRTRRMNMPCK